ncbi:hypothetical protein CH282_15275 [Rhodococcus sp. 06-418-1B]|nr:hypothetical protein [Rhodococcus sp. 06-418-1B]OZC84496.1 hypothetical protein CH282_15275 [Rhodococcus sp. 06-418-1B]
MTNDLQAILDESFTAIEVLIAAEKADDPPKKFSALLRYRLADTKLREWYENHYGANVSDYATGWNLAGEAVNRARTLIEKE